MISWGKSHGSRGQLSQGVGYAEVGNMTGSTVLQVIIFLYTLNKW